MSHLEPTPVVLGQLRPGHELRAINETRGLVVAEEVRLALAPWRRLRGLIGDAPLQPRGALLLRPCQSIHTCFMRYPLDVLFLDAAGRVVGLVRELRPWRFSPFFPRARGALELNGGAIDRTGTERGDVLSFVEVGPRVVSR